MKKTLLLATLLGTIVCAGLIVYLVWQDNRGPESFYERGEEYFKEGKHQEAAILFLNALQRDERYRNARYLLALTYMHQERWGPAERELRTLLRYYPEDVEAQLRLGTLYLVAGQTDRSFFHRAQEISQQILAREPDNVPALLLSGNAAAGLQDYRLSVELLEKAVRLDPENVPAFISLGAYRIIQGNLPQAEAAFLKARAIDPKNKNAIVSLANYYRATGKPEEAETVFKEGLALYPADKEIYLPALGLYWATRRFDLAEQMLREAQSKSPEDPGPSLVLADLYQGQDRLTDVRKLLAELKAQFPDNIPVAKKIALLLIKTDFDAVRAEIDKILKSNPKDPEGLILLGELQYFLGEIGEAEKTFNHDLLRNSAYAEPQFFLGTIAARRGRLERAQNHYQKALTVQAHFIPARIGLAETLFHRGMLADARVELDKLLRRVPGQLGVRVLKANLDTAQKNYPAAEREIEALLGELPDNVVVRRAAAHHYNKTGRNAEAEKHLLRALEIQPGSEEILREIVQFYLEGKQYARAAERARRAAEATKRALPYELLGLAYSQAGDKREAQLAYRKAIEIEPKRISSYFLLAQAHQQSGRYEDALKTLDDLLKVDRFHAPAYNLRGYLYNALGKVDQAKESYTRALEMDPNSAAAANNLAYLLAERDQDLALALKWAQAARKLEPENPNYADTLGWIYYKTGNYILARDQLRFAAGRQPDNPAIRYHLGMACLKTERVEEARNAFRQALSSNKSFKEKPLAEAALREISKSDKSSS